MIGKDFDSIEKEDICALVTNQVTEKRNLEYKQELPQRSDKDSKEFLADVSSFANAGGGDPPKGYWAMISLPHGEEKSLSLTDFTKDDGEKFNPETHRVMRATIGGGGYNYSAYGK